MFAPCAEWRSDWLVVRWLAPLAFLHGLLYLVLVPPWQHYDEPGHFAYAAEVAAGEYAAPGPAAVQISREIADSMYRYSFYAPGERPFLFGPEAVQVGFSQRVHPPLYYSVVAQPIAWLRYLPVEYQLYAARMVGLALYVFAVLAAWRVAVTILPDEPLMQLVIPLLLLFTPTFTDMMTAVNSDVLVNFAAVVSFLGCALLLRDGLRPTALLLALLGLAVALFAKRTAVPALIPVALALAWAGWRQPLPWRILLPVGVVGSLLLGGISLRFESIAGDLRIVPRAWLYSLDQRYLRVQIEQWLLSIEDWERSSAVYPDVVTIIFDSFWARLAWSHVSLGTTFDSAMRIVAVAVGVGLLRLAWQLRNELSLWQRRFIWLLFVSICVAWLVTILRVHPLPPPGEWFYIPRGRYMFWAMLPHLWLLALGWQGIFPARWRAVTPLVLLLLFVGVSIYTWGVVLVDAYYF